MVLNFTACGKANVMCLKEIAPYTTARIVRGLIEEEIRFTDFKSKEQELFFKSDIKEDNRQLTAPSIVNKRVRHSGERRLALAVSKTSTADGGRLMGPTPASSRTTSQMQMRFLLTLAALHHVNQAAPSSLDKPLQKATLYANGLNSIAGRVGLISASARPIKPTLAA
ncbi:hypothetical protein T12_14005 [Trichinella patagoniensis]|uniref:Uncharacterized protein n=1 Tax=Trichinella patagoniensis TaxID=990121 RepID=A0A0V1A3G0_9BILA|nr:hypothetical protein T09_6483 [Trichinella sp. T9]KRY19392.1 hypothetical protein T12_14005 [Trichinella patagoniensis]KRZ91403.1 hypothetical protein T08_7606 [Trichinella sp. T8]